MGNVRDAFDNAMALSFFATLTEELVYRRAWPTRYELEMEVFSFTEGFYNPIRRHSGWATSAPPPTKRRSRHRPRRPADRGHFKAPRAARHMKLSCPFRVTAPLTAWTTESLTSPAPWPAGPKADRSFSAPSTRLSRTRIA